MQYYLSVVMIKRPQTIIFLKDQRMPFCKHFTTLCSRNAGCDLSSSSYRKVPEMKSTEVKSPKMSYEQPHTALPSKLKLSLRNPFSNCTKFEHHPSSESFSNHPDLTFAKYFLDLLSFWWRQACR